MTAIVQDRYSSAPEDLFRLAEIARPPIGDDEVLVRVHAASVDRGTWHIMSGLPYPIRLAGFGLRRPKYANPGRSLAGTVEAVGTGVTGFAAGRRGVRHRPRHLRRVRRAPEPASSPRSRRTSPSTRRPPSRSPGAPPCRPSATTARPGRREGTDHRRVGRRRHLRGADREGVRRRGHRRVQHRPRSTWSAPSAPTTSSTTPATDFAAGGHRYDVILDIGGNSPAVAPPACPHLAGTADHRRRRDRRTVARRQRPPDPGASCCPRSSARSWAHSSRRRTPPT